MDNNNVSAKAIDDAINYIKEEFTSPLVQTGRDILDSYEKVGEALQNEEITQAIENQRNRVDNLSADLEDIFNTARQSAEDSNAEIKENQANINNEIVD